MAGLRGYLLVAALIFFAGAGAFVQLAVRAGAPRAEADNRDVHHMLDRSRDVRIGQCVASGILALAACVAYEALGLERYALVVALALLVLHLAYLLGSVPYWNRVLTYAQAG